MGQVFSLNTTVTKIVLPKWNELIKHNLPTCGLLKAVFEDLHVSVCFWTPKLYLGHQGSFRSECVLKWFRTQTRPHFYVSLNQHGANLIRNTQIHTYTAWTRNRTQVVSVGDKIHQDTNQLNFLHLYLYAEQVVVVAFPFLGLRVNPFFVFPHCTRLVQSAQLRLRTPHKHLFNLKV